MISEEKQKLRKTIKSILTSYKENFKKDSNDIMNMILESPEYKKSDIILSYMALPDEVFLDNLFFSSSKKVFIPKVSLKNKEMEFYNFSQNNLETGAYNILEPSTSSILNNNLNIFSFNDSTKKSKILVLIPGRAFTITGNRLGRGKGYYDKYLEKLFSLFDKRNVTLVGVCFKPQIVKTIPTETHDILMDKVITTK